MPRFSACTSPTAVSAPRITCAPGKRGGAPVSICASRPSANKILAANPANGSRRERRPAILMRSPTLEQLGRHARARERRQRAGFHAPRLRRAVRADGGELDHHVRVLPRDADESRPRARGARARRSRASDAQARCWWREPRRLSPPHRAKDASVYSKLTDIPTYARRPSTS